MPNPLRKQVAAMDPAEFFRAVGDGMGEGWSKEQETAYTLVLGVLIENGAGSVADAIREARETIEGATPAELAAFTDGSSHE